MKNVNNWKKYLNHNKKNNSKKNEENHLLGLSNFMFLKYLLSKHSQMIYVYTWW